MTTKQKTIKSITGLLIAIFLFFSPVVKIPVLDSSTDAYFHEAITKAGITYATCRVINASASIIKESSLQLEPAGVGMSLAAGQVLDPIDDMTERLSDVLVTAITSLGVQELAYQIGIYLSPLLVSICFLVLSVLIWFKNERFSSLYRVTMNILLIVLVARFCLPVSSIANNYIYQHYFMKQISEAKDKLTLYSDEFDKLKEFTLPEIDGVLGTIKNSASFLEQKAIEYKNSLVDLGRNMNNLIENLLKLTFLYVGIFLIQVLFLPLLSFWLLAKIANSLFLTSIPIILQHPRRLE